MTNVLESVLRTLLAAPGAIHGYEVCTTTGIVSATIYPTLKRLVAAGWLEEWWEADADRPEKRARRHYYAFTAEGRKRAIAGLRYAADRDAQARSRARYMGAGRGRP